MKFQLDTWVYFKGPNNQYYQGLIKEYDLKDWLYKIEYFHDDGFVKNAYVLEKEILDFKFKSGDEVQFRCNVAHNVAWKRGKICSSYADKDGQIFYDINPWDEMVKAYDSLRGYKEIPEINVRPYTNYDKIPYYSEIFADKKSYEYFKDFPLDFKKNLFNDIFGFRDNAVIKVETDSIKTVWKEKDIMNRPRNHKFVRTNPKERRIKEVIFNGPATIIKWEPTMHDYANGKCKGDKTVSVCGVTDPYDKEKGFLLAVIKEFVDNQSYDNILRMMDSFNDEERK